jgi:molecular chaperone GrpE
MARKKKSEVSQPEKEQAPNAAETPAEQPETVVEAEAAAETETATETAVQAETETETEAEAEAEASAQPGQLEALTAQLAEAQAEATRNLENWQRTAAELANFKRRQEEQMKMQRDRIKAEVLEGVISALDDLDLAFQNLPEELDGQLVGWVEGFRLVQRKLGKILDDQNVMPIPTDGAFDPNFHEAVSYEDHNDHETDHIIAELRKGYQIGSRVIRPALVRVAR